MNCFQICIFAGDLATTPMITGKYFLLWIAFKFVSLQEIWQHFGLSLLFCLSCELLSNLYLCRRFGNAVMSSLRKLWLWIAFKFVSLQEIWQLNTQRMPKQYSCELLSNLYLCRRFGNPMPKQGSCETVVNCFQICIFAGDLATLIMATLIKTELWIAFKFVSLQEIWQLFE